MQVAFAPRFFWILFELPVIETGSEATGDWLMFPSSIVVTEAIIRQPQCFRQHPTFAVVLVAEDLDAFLAIATTGIDLQLKIVEGIVNLPLQG